MRHGLTMVRARLWPASRQALPALISGICLWALFQRLRDTGLSQIGGLLNGLAPEQWLAAMAATCVSFWALGRYDVVIHRQFGTGCHPASAARVGAASIALGQVLGMGALTGAVVRWRLLSGLTLLQTAKIAIAVAVSFLAGLVVIIGMVALVGQVPVLPWYGGAMILFSAAVVIVSACLNPAPKIIGRNFRWPTLSGLGQIMILTLIDTAAAAAALYFLMPQGLEIGFTALFAAYLLALAAALVTGTPGGVGPFELALLVLLPEVPEAQLMAGVLGFRLVYYALPAVVAVIYLYRGDAICPLQATELAEFERRPDTPSARSEMGVCHQNGARILASGAHRLAVISTPQTETALFEPLSGDIDRALPGLRQWARGRNKLALLYKTRAPVAMRCRKAGWKTLRVAEEMVLNPQRFTTEGRQRRQLRRKLRQAFEAGVIVKPADVLPVAAMAAVNAQWCARMGRARGVSMGRFCPAYLARHQVFLAWTGGDLMGFVSFHQSPHGWCLDLMRSTDDAPPGTMHLLVVTALRQARGSGLERLSLAAVPCPENGTRGLVRLWRRWVLRLSGGAGLAQFKASFAPASEPLYAHAPNWPSLVLGLIDLSLAIHRPDRKSAQDCDEKKEFAPMRHS